MVYGLVYNDIEVRSDTMLATGMRRLIWLAALLAHSSRSMGAQASWISGRAQDAVALWEFARDDCLAGVFPNTGTLNSTGLITSSSNAFGGLRRNASTMTGCLDGLGLQVSSSIASDAGVIVESYRDVHELSAAVALSGGFTVEIWAGFNQSTAAASSTVAPLFTIGQGNGGDKTHCESVNLPAMSMNLQLYQTGQYLSLVSVYEINQGTVGCDYFPPISTSSTAVPLNQGEFGATQVVLTLNQTTIKFFVDGVAKYEATNTFPDTGSLFSTVFEQGYKAQLLSDHAPLSPVEHAPFDAPVWLAAVYARALSSQEVTQNYDAKLPDSPPSVVDTTATIYEDGEAVPGAHYTTPLYYSSPVPPLDLELIPLDGAYDQDETLGYPNYDAQAVRNTPMRAFVAAVSDGTELFDVNGNVLIPCPQYDKGGLLDGTMPPASASCEVIRFESDSQTPHSNLSSPLYLRARPPFNEYSFSAYQGTGQNNKFPLGNFTFWAVDGVTGERSTDTATHLLVVAAVNDPPVAHTFTTRVVGDSVAAITLNATDVDGWAGDASFAWGYVSKMPSQGQLVRLWPNGSVASGTQGGALNASLSTSSNEGQAIYATPHDYTVSKATATASIAYVFTGNQTAPADARGVIATDSFAFYVVDIWGAKSSAANITVEVTKGIYAYASLDSSTEPTAVEGEWSPLQLYGDDHTLNPQNLSFRITSLPSFGELRDPITKATLAVGNVLVQQVPYPYTSPAVVEYRGSGNYFNSPTIMWNGTAIHASTAASGAIDTDQFSFQAFRSTVKRFSSVKVYLAVTVVNVNDCPVLGARPPDGSTYEATVVAKDGANSLPSDGSSGGASANTTVGYTWSVLAVGVESKAYKRWDGPNYEPPDLLGGFGLWLSDAADHDVDFVKVRISALHGLVGFDLSNNAGPYSGRGGGAAEWLDSMDFNSEKYCHVTHSSSTDDDNDDDLINDDIALRQRRRLFAQDLPFATASHQLSALLSRFVDWFHGSNSDGYSGSAVPNHRRLAHVTRRAQNRRQAQKLTTNEDVFSSSPHSHSMKVAIATTATASSSSSADNAPTMSPTFATLYSTCEGDGSMDREMVFLGQPSEVSKVLSSLVYTSPLPNIHDMITVEVWDGAGAGTGCMPETDFKTYSERPLCYSLSLNLPVAVGPYAFETTILADGSSSSNWPAGFYAPLGFIPVLLYVWLYSRKLKRQRAQREARDPEYAALIAARTANRSKAFHWWRRACGAAMPCCQRSGKNDDSGIGDNDADNNDNGSVELSSMSSFAGNNDHTAAVNNGNMNRSDNGNGNSSGGGVSHGHSSSSSGANDDDDQSLEFPCGASGSRFEILRRIPLYARLPGQETAVAGQLAGDFAGQKRILDSTESSEADAGAWEVSYLASGVPMFVHSRTGFRTFDKPPALGGESSVVLPRKPVSTLAALPVQSNWHEHRAVGSGDVVYYRNAKTGEVSWEDPYTSTLDAAAALAGHSAGSSGSSNSKFGAEPAPLITSDHWTRCVSSLDGKVYWHNAATGVSTWEEPGTSYIRNAIRNAEHTAALQRQAADASNGHHRHAARKDNHSPHSGANSPSSGHSASAFVARAKRRASKFFSGYSQHHHPENSSSEGISYDSQGNSDGDGGDNFASGSSNLLPNSVLEPSAKTFRGASTTSLDLSPTHDDGDSTML